MSRIAKRTGTETGTETETGKRHVEPGGAA